VTRTEAFFEQAKSDFAMFESLQAQGALVAECHVLHYLQMATEKLAKAVAARTGIQVPARRHDSFSRLAGALATRPDILSGFGYTRANEITRFLSMAMPVFQQLENLNPALANEKARKAGRDWETEPNCEYPWWRQAASGEEDWLAPAAHTFPAFQTVREKQGYGANMMKLVRRLFEKFKDIP